MNALVKKKEEKSEEKFWIVCKTTIIACMIARYEVISWSLIVQLKESFDNIQIQAQHTERALIGKKIH